MNSRGGSRAQEEAVSYHPVLSLPCCRGGPGPAHTTEPPGLGQGSTRGSLIRADRSASLQRVPAGTQLLPGTISGGWRHREAVHMLQLLGAPLPIRPEAVKLHHHGAVTFVPAGPRVSSRLGQSLCSLHLFALYLSVFSHLRQ